MRTAFAVFAVWAALPSPSFAAPQLSSGGWDLAPLDGLFDAAAPSAEHEIKADAAVAEVRRDLDGLPAFRYARPDAPRIPNVGLPEPDSIDGDVERLLWAVSARAQGDPRLRPLPKAAKRIYDGRPDAFSLAALPHRTLGEFTYEAGGAPQVKLNERLKRLRAKGVPSEFLATVLVHELDHGDEHFAGRCAETDELCHELRAFQSEAAYLRLLGEGRIRERLEAAAEAGDPEVTELYADMALILEADKQGLLPFYIRRAYGGAR